MIPNSGVETAAEVAAVIRAEIVSGQLAAGSEIALAELSEQLDVPMATTREALVRLVDQRMVAVSPDHGYRVAEASRHELRELTQLRQLIEGEAVRLSVEHGDERWIRSVRDTHAALAEAEDVAADLAQHEEWRTAHSAFHEALCAQAHNDRLVSIAGVLRDEAEIYRQLSGTATTPARRAEVAGEHRRLMELAVAGRAEEAAALLRAHLAGTMDSVMRSVWPGDAV